MTIIPYRRYLLLAGSLCGSAVAAQVPVAAADTGRTYSLTAEQKAALGASGTEASAELARRGPDRPSAMAGIHGEVGAVVGSGGTRGMYGTAAIPLGENAGAVVSFENSRFGDRRRR